MLGPTEPLGDVGPTTQNPCHSQGCVGPSCADPRYLNAPLVLPRKTHRALRMRGFDVLQPALGLACVGSAGHDK